MSYNQKDFFSPTATDPDPYNPTPKKGYNWEATGGQTPGAGAKSFGTNGDDDDAFSLYSDTENPDPYAYSANQQGFMVGGQAGRADAISGFDRERGDRTGNQQAFQMDPGQQNQARGYQNAAAGSYMDTLRGRNPSLAQQQLQQGLAQTNAGASSMAASSRGGGANMAAAQRNAMLTQGQAASNTNAAAGMQRAQEINMAQQGLAQTGGQMRNQDQGWQKGLADNEMGQRNLNNKSQLGWEGMAQANEGRQLEASKDYEKLQWQAEEEARKRRWDQEKTNTEYAREDQKGVMDSITSLFS